ncbi:hypothetical protein [Dactylosporangium sp. CA-139066]|uniref:hypothetical protein n=1 Tax=Dactylosporangium sp. CA-139066 TaxID=3239930 RepID=UPI003D8CF64F
MTLPDERELRASTVPTGQRRTLSVSVRDGSPPPRLMFIEKYTGDGTGWLGRFTSFRAEALLDGDPEPLIAAIAELAGAGKLDRPPMGARERVADLLEAAGLVVRRESTVPWLHLGRRGTLGVAPDGRRAGITFTQSAAGEARFQVVAAYDDLDAVAAHLALSSTVDVAPADRLGRFFALFEAFADGEVNAERVQRMLRDAGVESERRDERRYRLLHVDREHTDCIFTLTLLVSAIEDKITFTEFYDYLPRSGDAGREYGYGATTPHASLPQLTAHFAARLGREPAAGPDGLAACFRELVDRGVLGEHQAIESNRNLVAGWFTDAGVPWRPDDWVWFNSD